MKNFPWKPLLQNHPIFSTIQPERIETLLEDGVSEENDFPSGFNIVRQSDRGNSLFVIGSGSAEALLEVGGGEPIHLSTMRKGDVFGEMAFFEQASRAATVRTKEPCTVLEIRGPELQKLVDEYPQLGSKLLLMMGERLRQTNERILFLHLKTVDEKLDLFNKRLETDQAVAAAKLQAAQTVFDQVKIRTDEVISNAERSRDRLTKTASVVGTFVTILIGLLGLFGYKELSRVDSFAKDSEQIRNQAKGSADAAEKSLGKVDAIRKKAEEAAKGLKELYFARFLDTLKKLSGEDAWQAYNQFKTYVTENEPGGIGDELHDLLYWMEVLVVSKAQPPPENDSPQQENVGRFVLLFQRTALDAKAPRDKLDAYYLLLVYAKLAGQSNFPETKGDYAIVSSPEAARHALQEYRRSTPGEKERYATEDLIKWIAKGPGETRNYLSELSGLALVSLKAKET